MIISAKTIKKLNALSDVNKRPVADLAGRLGGSGTRKARPRFPDFLGILSLKLVDWFGPRSSLSDEEADAYIASVRAGCRGKRKRRIFRMAREINAMFRNARRPDQTGLAKESAEFERMMLECREGRSGKG